MMSLYGRFRTSTFSEIYPDVDTFLNEYNNSQIPTTLNDSSAITPNTLYYLLYANYGNSNIASSDVNRFKYKMWSLIWQYGPKANREREIQAKLINLSEDELLSGSTHIYNMAENPSTEPETDSDDILTYINHQNVTKHKKGMLEGYALLDSLLTRDVVQEFINRFKGLFLTIVQPEEPLLYGDIDSDVATF